jgi:hypothetical protein
MHASSQAAARPIGIHHQTDREVPMTVHFHQRHNETERTAWRQSVATLVATLNNPTLIAAVLFCLITSRIRVGS